VECDGVGYHSEPKAVTMDALRHNAFVGCEWTVLRITWGILEGHLDEFVALLSAVLSAGAGGRARVLAGEG
jgi:very-short-patch-repair endonuclease